jgi:hypothetical protein
VIWIKTLALLAILTGCGKVTQVQEGVLNMAISNDVKMVELRIGALYRDNAGGYDYLEYENTRYRIGTVASAAADGLAQLPAGQLVPVYFKGKFVKRSGISATYPQQVFDVVDLEAVVKK